MQGTNNQNHSETLLQCCYRDMTPKTSANKRAQTTKTTQGPHDNFQAKICQDSRIHFCEYITDTEILAYLVDVTRNEEHRSNSWI